MLRQHDFLSTKDYGSRRRTLQLTFQTELVIEEQDAGISLLETLKTQTVSLTRRSGICLLLSMFPVPIRICWEKSGFFVFDAWRADGDWFNGVDSISPNSEQRPN
jgi:hypothetical protein